MTIWGSCWRPLRTRRRTRKQTRSYTRFEIIVGGICSLLLYGTFICVANCHVHASDVKFCPAGRASTIAGNEEGLWWRSCEGVSWKRAVTSLQYSMSSANQYQSMTYLLEGNPSINSINQSIVNQLWSCCRLFQLSPGWPRWVEISRKFRKTEDGKVNVLFDETWIPYMTYRDFVTNTHRCTHQLRTGMRRLLDSVWRWLLGSRHHWVSQDYARMLAESQVHDAHLH